MQDYDINQIADTYLNMCFSDGQKYIKQFPKEVRSNVADKLLRRVSEKLKKANEFSSLELYCSEHGCLESHF